MDGYSLSQTQAYTVAAVLAVDILQNSGPLQQTAQEDYSFAMWGLFDPYGNGVSGDAGAFGQLALYGDTADLNAAQTDLNNAISYIFTQRSAGSG